MLPKRRVVHFDGAGGLIRPVPARRDRYAVSRGADALPALSKEQLVRALRAAEAAASSSTSWRARSRACRSTNERSSHRSDADERRTVHSVSSAARSRARAGDLSRAWDARTRATTATRRTARRQRRRRRTVGVPIPWRARSARRLDGKRAILRPRHSSERHPTSRAAGSIKAAGRFER
jgi:hypothetical protein